MISSEVKNHNGVPTLFVNGQVCPGIAYMTYLEEYARYGQFAEAGYKLYSVPVLFAGRWISVTEGMKPFHSGIFDNKGKADFSSFEHSVELILNSCPDALIIPRINISMPLWWIEENPDCLDSTGNRELLSSEKWRNDAGKLLKAFLDYLNTSEYASHIAALHLAGGNTEEWFYFDMKGGCCENAVPEFKKYLAGRGPEFAGLPDLAPLGDAGTELHGSEYLRLFLDYSNNAVADSVKYFAGIAKECTARRLAVGVFYGYSLEVPSSLMGAHALKKLLVCRDIDFICSPNSYIGNRDRDTEWSEMYAADSVRLHGKMCMQECDIRTHLTKPLPECAPEYDTLKKMTAPIWHGLKSKADSLRMIRKSFDRQLRKGNGLWWFDMWGGWYDDPDIMLEMKKMRGEYIAAINMPDRKKAADIAVFVDEDAYSYMGGCALRFAPFDMRRELGKISGSYDMYDVFDFDTVKDRYGKFIFISGQITPASKRAVEYCKENRIPFLCNSFGKEYFTAEEIEAKFEGNY